MQDIQLFDPELYAAVQAENKRQIEKLELIASENIVSPRVLAMTGSVLTNKYAEGYPAKRYYGGCEEVDITENLAIDRAKEIFQAEHANVQPHSGSQANMAVYMTELKPGDTILGMNLSHGGHLTHGSPVNFSGKLYNVVFYGVTKDAHLIDYQEVERLAIEHKPKIIVAGASAYARKLDFQAFKDIADKVGALLVVDMAHIAGLVAAGEHMNPVPYADYVTSTTHKTLRGPRGGLILCKEERAKKLNSTIFPGIQGGPLCHVIAAKAVAFQEAKQESFKKYAKQIISNAKALANAMQNKGYDLVSHGTDNHIVLLNLTNQGVTGKEVQEVLDLANITANRNSIPYDTQKPFITSGVRLGTPALTTRGMKEQEMEQIAVFIDDIIKNRADKATINQLASKVKEFASSFPSFCE